MIFTVIVIVSSFAIGFTINMIRLENEKREARRGEMKSVRGREKPPDNWQKATADVTVDEGLRLIEPSGRLTPEVIALLAGELPGISSSVAEVASMPPLVLAARLIGMPSVSEDQLIAIARELVAAFTALLEDGPAPQEKEAPQPKAAPQDRPTRTEAEYRMMLLDAAGPRRSSMSGAMTLGPSVIRSFSTMSGHVHLEGTIVLGDSSTMSGAITGHGFAPRGTGFSSMSGKISADIRYMSYASLARKAGLA